MRPVHFGAFIKNRNAAIRFYGEIVIFAVAHGAQQIQINTMMKKILFLMAAAAMIWGGVMQ